MITRLGIVLCTILLTVAGGTPARAPRTSMSSIASNLPQRARVTPIPTQPAPARLLRKVNPKYPPQAKKKEIQGTVRLRALIGKDGHVKKLSAISGPPMLVKAAETAVRQWVYEPALLNGKPVEVATFITVVFTLPKHEKDKEKQR